MSNNNECEESSGGSQGLPRRDFLRSSAMTAGTLVAATIPSSNTADAAQAPSNPEHQARKTILAVGAHMSDAELGAGGVLIQAARAGHRVVIVTVVSDFRSWLPTVGHEEETKRKLLALAERYGFEKRFLDYPYHQIHGGDVGLKRKLAEIYVEVKPQVAFIHHVEDHWPDHVACGQACHDAFLFSHGLSHDMHEHRCPLIYSYTVTPGETYRFEPDVYYDVGDVMSDYMELLIGCDSCDLVQPVEKVVQHEFRTLGKSPQTIRLSPHGVIKLADCLRFGNIAGCRFAMGFRTVWGRRRGEDLFGKEAKAATAGR
jgi:LmbE family N-acetylglucosaminyl deacetylase